MSTRIPITYQLIVQGGPDVILRLLPSDTSISESVGRAKDALDVIEDRIQIRVYDENATGTFQPREPAPDEIKELEAALEQSLGSRITVHGYEDPAGR